MVSSVRGHGHRGAPSAGDPWEKAVVHSRASQGGRMVSGAGQAAALRPGLASQACRQAAASEVEQGDPPGS